MRAIQIKFKISSLLVTVLLFALGLCFGGGCASAPKKEVKAAPETPQKQPPPKSGEPKEVAFPKIHETILPNGLKLVVAELPSLPVVYSQFVVKAGSIHDPLKQPGLASLVAKMLEEGTKKRTSSELAEEVEFLGADLWASSQKEFSEVGVQSLSKHFDETLNILADVVLNPRFDKKEFQKLQKRELARLALLEADPSFLARRETFKALYGEHQYAAVDTNSTVVEKLKVKELKKWHQSYFRSTNSFLVVVGDVSFGEVKEKALKAFGKMKGKHPKPPELPPLPVRDKTEVVLVDRPESVQTVIRIGNLALERGSEDWTALMVANQVLGGTAASRLFMDLREKRSLTYGAYSGVGEFNIQAPFQAMTSCRNEVTEEALGAMFLHLEKIVSEEVSDQEFRDAKKYLSDSFPLKIDSGRKVLDLIVEQQVFGLGEDYWNTYRGKIQAISSKEALEAAKNFIKPHVSLIVAVGKASQILEPLRKYGPVKVLDPQGRLKQEFEKLASEEESD